HDDRLHEHRHGHLMSNPRALVVTLEGKPYKLRAGELSALDAKEFHTAIGVRLLDVFRRGPQDLDEVAGLVWLCRRRREPGLPYEVVAADINYDSVLTVESEDKQKPPAKADSQESDEDPAD